MGTSRRQYLATTRLVGDGSTIIKEYVFSAGPSAIEAIFAGQIDVHMLVPILPLMAISHQMEGIG